MPWDVIFSIVLGLAKWIFEVKAKKKLNDAEFLQHIEAHQKRRGNAGKSAQDFEDAMKEAEGKVNEVPPKDPTP